MNLRYPRWLLATLGFFSAHLLPVVAETSAPAATRAAFLRLIDRPRVPSAIQLRAPMHREGFDQVSFSYAVEATQRVPGLLVKLSTSTGRRPVVIALHGTGGNKEGQLPFLEEMARAGFIAVAIDGRYHGERAKVAKGNVDYNEAILRAYRTGTEHPFFYDSVWDVMRLIDYLETREDVDPRRIGVLGISKGGIETYLAAAVDPRIAVAIPCISVESFRWALDHDSWQSRIGTIQVAFDAAAKDAGVEKPGADFVRRFYDKVAPGIYGEFDGPAMVPLIAPRPLLSINGELDPRTPGPGLEECAVATRAAYTAQHAAEKFALRIQPNTAHKVNPDSMIVAREWFVRWLQP